MTIAGHSFVGGRCACGWRWVDLRAVGTEHVGAKHIAHIGELNDSEVREIAVAREAEDAAIARAMGWERAA